MNFLHTLRILWAELNSDEPGVMKLDAAFHHGQHYLIRQKTEDKDNIQGQKYIII